MNSSPHMERRLADVENADCTEEVDVLEDAKLEEDAVVELDPILSSLHNDVGYTLL